MAETLKEFLVTVGFQVDTAGQAKALERVKTHEAKVTAVTKAEGHKRLTIEIDLNDKVDKQADNQVKRVRERNAAIFKDTRKHLTELTGLIQGVAQGAGIVGGAFATSTLFRSIVRTGGMLSQSFMEARRSGAAPRNIERLVYGLSQMGVGKDEARGSFDNFARALQEKPGLRNMLAGAGIDMRGDPAQIMAQLGRYFSSMPQNVALNRAGTLGIGQDTMIALQRQAELRDRMGEYDKTNLGLDPDQAAEDGRKFTAAYDKLATDLKAIQTRINNDFLKPLTTGFTALSDTIEKHPEQVKLAVEAFELLSSALALRLIPKLLRVTGLMGLLKPPVWLLRLLGFSAAEAGILAGAAIATATPTNAGEPSLGADGRLHRPDGSVVGGPSNGETGHYRGGPRRGLGIRTGIDADIPGPSGSDDPLKKFITAHEGGGYNVVYGHNERGGPNAPPKPITEMTIAEVLAYQHAMRAKNGTPAWPVGRAQWTESTLRGLTRGMDPNTKLDAELQERLFDRSIAGRMRQGPQGFRFEWDSLKGLPDREIQAMIDAHRAYKPPPPQVPQRIQKAWDSVRRGAQPGGASPYGGLDRDAFPAAPLTSVSPSSLYQSYDNRKTSGDFHQNVAITAHGTDARQIADAVRATARRGGKDYMRYMQGSVA